MHKKMRVMSKKPLNAETYSKDLRTWITDNKVFFKRNQGQIPEEPVSLIDWRLCVDGLVLNELSLSFQDIQCFPKVEMANTLECSGNSRSLLSEKASGNPWVTGGVGNAVWGGVRLSDVLEQARIAESAKHISFEGADKPMGSAGIKFIRSIPIEKALTSTLLVYEMNGTTLPLEHGYPLRSLPLGWTGANSVKWLNHMRLLEKPFEGFFMDKVYRVFQKGEDPKSGSKIKSIPVNAIINEPESSQTLQAGLIPIRGLAYAGEAGIDKVEVSINNGETWQAAKLIGPDQPYAWRHWETIWDAKEGDHTIMARATDSNGIRQPDTANWNKLGYGNNGIQEHAVKVHISPEYT